MGKKPHKDKREDKIRRLTESIAYMKVGDTIAPSTLFNSKEVGIHPNTGRDYLDVYEALKELDFEILRNSEGEIKLIIKTEPKDSEKNLRKEITDIKENIKKIMEKLEIK